MSLELIATPPASTIFILFLSMVLSLITSLANRFLINQEQLRAWRKEVADWTSEFREATRSDDKKLLAKLKRQQPRITKLQSKMTWQSMKVSFIFMIPFLLLWYLFLTPLYGGVPAVAYIPGIPGFWEGTPPPPSPTADLPIFLWYLFCSFLFGTLWSRVLGLAVGTTGATE